MARVLFSSAHSGTSSVTINRPADMLVADNVALVIYSCNGANSGALTVPAGWVKLPFISGAWGAMGVAAKVGVGAAEPASYRFAYSSSTTWSVAFFVVTECGTDLGQWGTITSANANNGTSLALKTQAPDTPKLSMIMAACAFGGGGGTVTNPPGWGNRFDTTAGVTVKTVWKDNPGGVTGATIDWGLGAASSRCSYINVAVPAAVRGGSVPKAQGGYLWDSTRIGATQPKSEGGGGYTWAATLVGAPRHSAVASGGYSWAGSSKGSNPAKGSAGGGYTWDGDAVALRPGAGDGAGDYNWRARVTGNPARTGYSTSDYRFPGTSRGLRDAKAVGAGTYLWSSYAAGLLKPSGLSGGSYQFQGVARSSSRHGGAAGGGYLFNSVAVGWTPVHPDGSAVGWFQYDSDAVGAQPTPVLGEGTTRGAYKFHGAARGPALPLNGIPDHDYLWRGFMTMTEAIDKGVLLVGPDGSIYVYDAARDVRIAVSSTSYDEFPPDPRDGERSIVNGKVYEFDAQERLWGLLTLTAGIDIDANQFRVTNLPAPRRGGNVDFGKSDAANREFVERFTADRDANNFRIKNLLEPEIGDPGLLDATNREYVDEQIANLALYQGTWQVGAGLPDLTPVPDPANPGDWLFPLNGYTWIAVTADPLVPETAPLGLPGIGGLDINNGDTIKWSAATDRYDRIIGSGLSKRQADTFYAQLVGGFGEYTTGEDYETGRIIGYQFGLYQFVRDVTNAPVAPDPLAWRTLGTSRAEMDQWYASLVGGFGLYQLGADYPVGRIIEYNYGLYKCVASVTNAPAIIDPLKWTALGGIGQDDGDARYAQLVGGFGNYRTGANYALNQIIQYNNSFYQATVQITNAPAVLDPLKWQLLGGGGAGGGAGFDTYTPGADYPVGSIMSYDNLLHRSTTNIYGAPAEPDWSQWQAFGHQASDYWQGAITSADWASGNWVHIGTVPSYFSGDVMVSANVTGNDSAYRLSVTTGYSSGNLALLSSSKTGSGAFSRFRLSAVTPNGQPCRIEALIANNSKPSNLKVFISGVQPAVTNAVSVPAPPTPQTGGANLGGSEYIVINADNPGSLIKVYTTGAQYNYLDIVAYDNVLFQVTSAITSATATPDHSKWKPFGEDQTDYWQGSIPSTDANWIANNWVLLATMPAYFAGEVNIAALVAANDSSYRLSVVGTYGGGSISVIDQKQIASGLFSEFRLSANGGQSNPIRLEGKIAQANKPVMKIMVNGVVNSIQANTATIPNPPTAIASGANMGGTQYDLIDSRTFTPERLSTARAILRGGDTNSGGNKTWQLGLGYNGGVTYPHYIATRHNGSANSIQNAIDFFVSDGTQNPASNATNVNTVWAGSHTTFGLSVPSGTNANPSINFGSQTGAGSFNTGIYSPGGSQIAFTLNSTEFFRLNSDQIIFLASGSNTKPVITWSGDTNTGFHHPADDSIAVDLGGAERFRFYSSGLSAFQGGVDFGFNIIGANSNNENRKMITCYDSAARRTGEIRSNNTGFNYGVPESEVQLWHGAGGWGWQMPFRTQISGGGGGIWVSGDSSATTHTNRSSRTVKQNISDAELDSIVDHIAVVTYQQAPAPAPMSADGEPLDIDPPVDYDHVKTKIGFIAEDLAANPATRDLVTNADDPELMGWDIGQMVAVLTNEIQLLKSRIVELEGGAVTARVKEGGGDLPSLLLTKYNTIHRSDCDRAGKTAKPFTLAEGHTVEWLQQLLGKADFYKVCSACKPLEVDHG